MRADLGAAFLALHEAKARGWDWCLASSWCSDHRVVVAWVRAPGGGPAARARPHVAESVEAALAWAAAEVSP